ncbi:prepilin-type N-terminal cleavage/methylation domain-containing protein [Litoribacillus peritrichatus]|uniref:Type IV pilin protein n=1 Tax=Litoribacillus peritrichatus TaxID=718191 RepID=A0ABP7LWQ7_9GAMM
MIKTKGFTLIELMVTVAIIGILVSVALPAYNSYVRSGQTKVASNNLETLKLFEEAYYLNNNTYVAGTMTGGSGGPLETTLGFKPEGNNAGAYTYTVAACSGGNITDCYKITVTLASDTSVVETYEKN